MVHPDKHKKSKKRKHKRKEKHESSSSDDNVNPTEEWVEADSKCNAPIPKRDEWMDITDNLPTYSKHELKSKDRLSKKEEQQLRTLDKPGQHERELNPYWKDGGIGLPTNQLVQKSSIVSNPSVGDGGFDWLSRAYKRVLEQANEEGKTPEEIAAPRWGSFEKLKFMLKEAEDKIGYKSRRNASYKHERHSRYSTSERTFKRPGNDDNSYSKHSYEQKSQSSRPRWQKSGYEKFKDTSDKAPAETDHPHTANDDNSYSKHRYEHKSESNRPRWQKSGYEKSKNTSEVTSVQDSISSETMKPPMPEEVSRCDEDTIGNSNEPLKIQESLVPQEELLTKREMNDLGAKLIKAELLGNNELANKLRDRLKCATEVSFEEKSQIFAGKQEVVVLTQSNTRGLVAPLVCASTSGDAYSGGNRRKKHKLQTHQEGKRVCYFPDDGKYSLQEMFQKEKLTTADDDTAMYLKMAAGKQRLKVDDDFTIDDVFVDKQARYESEEKQAEHQKNRAISEHKKLNSLMDSCSYCLESKAMQKHLIVAVGSKVYLSLPSCQSLEEGHCYIVPMNHVSAFTHLDEDVWEEIQTFRKAVASMFTSQEKDCVFIETSLHLRRQKHTFLECIPLSLELGSMAPMYFKKAILESETEWAQNKKLVDLSKKDIRYSVPKGLPYFSVDFGLDGGFAHVVEDEKIFPDYFGHEILGGMLDIEPRQWLKPRREDFKHQSQKVLAFEEWWKPFNCTGK